jgi:MtN3 and saliva related transmembrane protein
MNIVVLGYVGGCITVLATVPQIIKIYNTKNASEISYAMLIMWIIGLTMTGIYGFKVNDIPVVINSSFSIFFSVIIACQKYFYESTQQYIEVV